MCGAKEGFFKKSIRILFTVICFSATGSLALSATPPRVPDPCEQSLTASTETLSPFSRWLEKLEQKVDGLIRERGNELSDSDIQHGIRMLLVKPVLHSDLETAAHHLMLQARAWATAFDKYLLEELKKFKGQQHDANSGTDSPFVKHVKSMLGNDFVDSAVGDKNPNGRNGTVRELVVLGIKQFIHGIKGGNGQTMLAEYSAQMKRDGKILAAKVFDDWAAGGVEEPDIDGFRQVLIERSQEWLKKMNAIAPLPEAFIPSKNPPRPLTDTDFLGLPEPNSDGNWEMKVPRTKQRIVYLPGVGASILIGKPKEPVSDIAPMVVGLHGAGSNNSNAASWSPLFDLFSRAGLRFAAPSLPGTLAPSGLALNNAKKVPERALYFYRLINEVERQSTPNRTEGIKPPVIAMGRSSGSTEGLGAELTRILGNGEIQPDQFPGKVDALVLTSASNPLTANDQTERLRKLGSDGFVVVHEGSLQQFMDYSNDLLARLDRILEDDPHAFIKAKSGNNMFFVQGHGDVDGGGAAAVPDLRTFTERYFPFAKIYTMEAPLQKYIDSGMNIDPNIQLGSHFLLSGLPKVTAKNRGQFPIEIPEELLPDFPAQNAEVLAYTWASIDYLIDLCPVTTEAEKSRLRNARRALTDPGNERPHESTNDEFGYLRYFVENHLFTKKQKSGPDIFTWQDVVNTDGVAPSQETLLSRMRRVRLTLIADAARIQKILELK